MDSLLHVGRALRGRFSTYTIVKELHKAADEGAVFLALYVVLILITRNVSSVFTNLSAATSPWRNAFSKASRDIGD